MVTKQNVKNLGRIYQRNGEATFFSMYMVDKHNLRDSDDWKSLDDGDEVN